MLKIFKYLKPFKTQIIFSICLIFLISAVQCYIPILDGDVLNFINLNKNDKTQESLYNQKINKLLILNFLFYFLCAVGKFIYNKFLVTVIHKSIKNMRQDIYAKINRLPIQYFDQNTVGDIMNKMTNNVDIISNGLQQTFASIIYSFFHITMLVIYMLYIYFALGIVVSLMIPFSFIVIFIINKKSRHIFVQRFDKTSEYNGFLQEKFNGQKEIILYNQQENVFKEFKKINQDLSQMIFKSNFLSSLVIPIVNSFTYIILTIVVVLGYFLIPSSVNTAPPKLLVKLGFITIQLGMFEAFTQFVWRLGNPINDLSHFFVITQSIKAAVNKVFEFLHEDEEKILNKKNLSLSKIEGRVSFSNVSFGYSKDQPIIKNINLNVQKHQKVAIVGSTGSGKTTLINLLTRFYEIDEGSITIDGIDIRDLNKKYLRQILGLVLQDVWLFKGTILDNIKYGSEDTTDEEVIEIAKQTKIHDFIMFKDKGYQTIINEELDNLSQGEKQLITITRTLLRDPSILILDEATSTIDTQMEMICQKSIQKLCENKTSFVIAHRLSTIVNSDVIVVLKNGFIIEQGKHEELLELKGAYHDLYHSQFQQ